MVIEIIGGLKLHSMALYADGWHMATHVAAFVITVGAYAMARQHSKNAFFSFGTGKMSVLGAYTSAIVLAGAPCSWPAKQPDDTDLEVEIRKALEALAVVITRAPTGRNPPATVE